MDNQELLLRNNNVAVKNGRIDNSYGKYFYVININEKELNGVSIHKIIKYVNYYIQRYANTKIPVLLSFSKEIEIKDKLTYIILECICYHLIKNLGVEVHILWKPKTDIITIGVNSSPLLLLNSLSAENVKKFANKFENDGYGSHFRRVVKKSHKNLCKAFQDVDFFFKLFNSCDMVKDEIIEAIAELVGNAFEHGCSDCLVDIDVADGYRRSDAEDGTEVYSVNIVVLNFSKNLIGDELKDRINNGKMNGERNRKLIDIYKYHNENFFDEKYTSEDFFNLAVFQDRISGLDKGESGGVGLTCLIKSLQQRSCENHCYMLSGKRVVLFRKDYLTYNADNWIGFNNVHDFHRAKPDLCVLSECDTFFPGTAYNLDFILMKGDRIDGQ